MPEISVLFLCGHESRYGRAHLEPLLRSEVFDVKEVILAPLSRWNVFRSTLIGSTVKASFVDGLRFEKRTRRIVYQIKSLRKCKVRFVADVNSQGETERAKDYDLIISVAYPQLFPSSLLTAPRLGAINFHPSFLPRCRGAHPIYWTIASREPFGGVSCHVMTEKIDEGPLIARRKIGFNPNTITYNELYDLVEKETAKLIKDVEVFFRNGGNPAPQIGDATYFRSDRELHRKIYFSSETPEEISAKIRAGGAFAFDRYGRKILFQPPVIIAESSVHITNNIQRKLLDGTVVSQRADEVEIKVANAFIKARVQIMGGCLERMIRKVPILRTIFYEKLTIGEVLR